MSTFKIRKWKGVHIAEAVEKEIGRALYKGASHILNEANKIAPKDEGTLIQTSNVDVDVEAGTASAYYVQKYAPRLHEHPEYNFQGGRQGKFLETPMLAEGGRVKKMMADEIKKAFGGGS